MKVAIPVAKYVLASLGITAAASATDAEVQKKKKKYMEIKQKKKKKKIHGSCTTTLIISNEKNECYNENCSSSWDSNILLKGVTKIIKNKTK